MTAPSRRTRITDAAIRTLAARGMRGLTHRAVDQAAGVAQGSTSYYFRTRDALLQGELERMLELELAELDTVPIESITAGEDFADAVTALIARWLAEGRERLLARYELALEATRRPSLHRALAEGRAAFEALGERLLASAGVPDPAARSRMLVALLDGFVFQLAAGLPAGELSSAEVRESAATLVRIVIGDQGGRADRCGT